MPRIVVTGADGFIGMPLARMLARAGHQVVPISRRQVVFGDKTTSKLMLESVVKDSQAVIHLAGRAHVMRESHADPLSEFRRTNVDGTLALAEASARAGVKRLVFMSSIGVLGNSSSGAAFTELDLPNPQGPYAVSKWEAEEALRALALKSTLEVVVVRPPLVYGPNVKGNFRRLLGLVRSGLPLPFAAVNNSRSYVGVKNLCEFLISSAFHPSAPGLTFHVADDKDLSTPELIRLIAESMGKRPRLFRCPQAILRAATDIFGKREEFERLISSLQVDSSLARSTLGWRPTEVVTVGMGEMVRSFVSTASSSA